MQDAATYRILTGRCWLPSRLAFVFGWGLAFLGVGFLSSVAIAKGRMGCATLAEAAEVQPWLPCASSRVKRPQEQHPVVPGCLRATGRSTCNEDIADWTVLVRLLQGEDGAGEMKGQLLRCAQVFLMVISVWWEAAKLFANNGYKLADVEPKYPPWQSFPLRTRILERCGEAFRNKPDNNGGVTPTSRAVEQTQASRVEERRSGHKSSTLGCLHLSVVRTLAHESQVIPKNILKSFFCHDEIYEKYLIWKITPLRYMWSVLSFTT